jgi:hypothetical protein
MSDQDWEIRDDQADVVSGGTIPIDGPVRQPTNPTREHDPIKPPKSNPAQ